MVLAAKLAQVTRFTVYSSTLKRYQFATLLLQIYFRTEGPDNWVGVSFCLGFSSLGATEGSPSADLATEAIKIGVEVLAQLASYFEQRCCKPEKKLKRGFPQGGLCFDPLLLGFRFFLVGSRVKQPCQKLLAKLV